MAKQKPPFHSVHPKSVHNIENWKLSKAGIWREDMDQPQEEVFALVYTAT